MAAVTRSAAALAAIVCLVAPAASPSHPDQQGVWANNTVTPFEWPRQLAGKATLSDDEVRVPKARAAEQKQTRRQR